MATKSVKMSQDRRTWAPRATRVDASRRSELGVWVFKNNLITKLLTRGSASLHALGLAARWRIIIMIIYIYMYISATGPLGRGRSMRQYKQYNKSVIQLLWVLNDVHPLLVASRCSYLRGSRRLCSTILAHLGALGRHLVVNMSQLSAQTSQDNPTSN